MKIIDNIKNWFIETNKAERIWMMAKIEFKLRYYENKLGLVWALLKPILLIGVYYLAFEVILGVGVENFPLYLFSGLMMWLFFVETTTGTMRILKTKRYLYEYTNMNKIEIYLASLLSSTIGLFFNLIVFFIAAIGWGVYPSWHAVYFPIIAVNLIILSMGFSLILSNLYIYFKDIEQIWALAVTAGIFLSPIFLRGDLFTEKMPILNYINPIAGIIFNTRDSIMYQSSPNWGLLGFDFLYAIVVLAIGVLVLKKLSPKASEVL